MSDTPQALHRRFVDEVVVAKRIELLDELFDADADLEQGSLDALRAQMQSQAQGLDIGVSYLHEFVERDWVVHHMDLTITHTGNFMGQIGSGRVAHLAEVEAARVSGGRIVEMWSVADRVGAMVQLGLSILDTSSMSG